MGFNSAFKELMCRRFMPKYYNSKTYGFGLYVFFRRVRKIATISFAMSVRPSACNNSAPTGRIFMKFYIRVFFETLTRKLKFH